MLKYPVSPVNWSLEAMTSLKVFLLCHYVFFKHIRRTFTFEFLSVDLKSNLGMPRPSAAADSYQPGYTRMTLENADLWKSFHNIGTEMIITKHGR